MPLKPLLYFQGVRLVGPLHTPSGVVGYRVRTPDNKLYDISMESVNKLEDSGLAVKPFKELCWDHWSLYPRLDLYTFKNKLLTQDEYSSGVLAEELTDLRIIAWMINGGILANEVANRLKNRTLTLNSVVVNDPSELCFGRTVIDCYMSYEFEQERDELKSMINPYIFKGAKILDATGSKELWFYLTSEFLRDFLEKVTSKRFNFNDEKRMSLGYWVIHDKKTRNFVKELAFISTSSLAISYPKEPSPYTEFVNPHLHKLKSLLGRMTLVK
jgi:hypothetical protein